MKIRTVFRIISLCMFVAAVVFIAIALSNPQLGSTIYIGNYKFGADAWRACYAIYIIIMISLFSASFFLKK